MPARCSSGRRSESARARVVRRTSHSISFSPSRRARCRLRSVYADKPAAYASTCSDSAVSASPVPASQPSCGAVADAQPEHAQHPHRFSAQRVQEGVEKSRTTSSACQPARIGPSPDEHGRERRDQGGDRPSGRYTAQDQPLLRGSSTMSLATTAGGRTRPLQRTQDPRSTMVAGLHGATSSPPSR